MSTYSQRAAIGWLMYSAMSVAHVSGQTPASTALVVGGESCARRIREERARFPAERYLAAEGIVGSVKDAGDGQARSHSAARANLAEDLEVSISKKLTATSEQSSSGVARVSAGMSIRTSAQTVLTNARVEAECYDPRMREYRALAVLDKREAAQSARAALDAKNERGRRLKADTEAQLEAGRVREAVQAIATLDELSQSARQDARMLGWLGAESPPAFAGADAITALRQRALERALIVVSVDDPVWGTKALIEDALAQEHLKVSADKKGPRAPLIEVRGRLRTGAPSHSELLEGTIVEVSTDMAIVNLGTKETIATIPMSERGSGSSAESATRAAGKRLAKAVAPKIRDAIVKHLGVEAP